MPATNGNTWIVVTDASRARLFSADAGSPLQKEAPRLIGRLTHAASRAKSADVLSDRPGRMSKRSGAGRFSTADRHPEPKQIEAEHFAQKLARMLEAGRNRREFDHLALAAPPHFLGLLRSNLSPQLKKHVAACVDKDYTRKGPKDLSGQLQEIIAHVQAERRRKNAE
jgi:protein required for attachment to host cells